MTKKSPKLDTRMEAATTRLREAQRVAELEDDDRVKLYRGQEAVIAKLTESNKLLLAKQRQAEADLLAAEARFDHMLATKPTGHVNWEKSQANVAEGTTPILALNDWHSEESVDPETVNGFNNFNLEIADDRIRRTFQKAVHFINLWRNTAKISDMVVWLGGDLITGYIHEELMESNFLSPTEASLWIEERVIGGLKFLRQHAGLNHIRVLTNHGNHGRTTPKRRVKTSYKNSFEWMAYNHIARTMSEIDSKFFSFNIGKGRFLYEQVQGHTIRFHHGDHIRYEGGIGGVTIPILKAIGQADKTRRADLDIFGHWHQFLDHWKFVACGCLIGVTDYSVEIKSDYQPPSQTLIFIDRKYGKAGAIPLFCEPKAMYSQPAFTE